MEVLPYDRQAALAYALRWAYGRNPAYGDFSDLGGDCTNFVSQCLYAGSGVMDFTPTFGWYYLSMEDRAPAWSGVEELYRFLTGAFAKEDAGLGPFGEESDPETLQPGDVLQLGDAGGRWYHSAFVTARVGGEVLLAAHSYDSINRPLSSYEYEALRGVRIVGVHQ